MLSPAACYPTYPLVAARGPLPADGLLFDVEATCFRREPSKALSRLQTFRMREFVRIGTPAQIPGFGRLDGARRRILPATSGSPATLDVANDPFFGRVGQIMAIAQRQDALKFELLIPYHPGAAPTACMSFNYHKEHFGEVWGIASADGELAHTSCVAFGMDRLAVAMFCIHGTQMSIGPRVFDQVGALSLRRAIPAHATRPACRTFFGQARGPESPERAVAVRRRAPRALQHMLDFSGSRQRRRHREHDVPGPDGAVRVRIYTPAAAPQAPWAAWCTSMAVGSWRAPWSHTMASAARCARPAAAGSWQWTIDWHRNIVFLPPSTMASTPRPSLPATPLTSALTRLGWACAAIRPAPPSRGGHRAAARGARDGASLPCRCSICPILDLAGQTASRRELRTGTWSMNRLLHTI